MLTVFALSLQQDFVAAAVLVQHVFPLAHFFFFLPLSVFAKLTPATNKAAVASNNTFFIIDCFKFF